VPAGRERDIPGEITYLWVGKGEISLKKEAVFAASFSKE